MEPVPFLIQLVVAAFISAAPQPAAAPTPPPVPATFAATPDTTLDQSAAEQLALRQAAAANKATEAASAKPSPSATPTGDGKTPPPDSAAVKEHLHLPLDPNSYVFTSDYGPRCVPIGGVPVIHDGLDLAAPLGTPIYAIADGTVVKVVDGVNDVNTNGGELAIQSTINGQTITYVYRHMLNTSQYLKVGDTVKAGQHVSDVASTGHSTGPHLHFEIHQGLLTDKTIDPEPWLKTIGLPVVENAKANYASHQDMSQCPTDPSTPAPSIAVAAGTETPAPAPSSPAAPAAPAATPAPAAPKPAPTASTPKPTSPAAPTSSPTTTPSTAASPSSVTVPLPAVSPTVTLP